MNRRAQRLSDRLQRLGALARRLFGVKQPGFRNCQRNLLSRLLAARDLLGREAMRLAKRQKEDAKRLRACHDRYGNSGGRMKLLRNGGCHIPGGSDVFYHKRAP